MAHIVEVTIAGGAYLGPKNDTKKSINADKIIEIIDAGNDEVGNSIIVMEGNKKLWVVETQAELRDLINN